MFRWLVIAALLVVQSTLAATPDQVVARVAEIELLRELRVEKVAPRPGEADIRKAAQGSVVSGLVGRKAWAVAVLDVPISQLWAGLNDETRHPGYTAVAYSELLAGKVCESDRRVLQYLPLPLVDDRWWIGVLSHNQRIARESGGSVRELYWRSSVDPAEIRSEAGKKIVSEAVPIVSTRGGWLLVAIDQFNTYLEYYSNTDPGSDLPVSMTSRMAAKSIRDQVAAMRKFALEGKPVCPVY